MTQQFDPLFTTGRSGNPYDLGDFALSRLDVERESAGWTMADTVAAGLVAVSLLAVLVLIAPGSLYLDDLRAQGYAQGQPFWQFIIGSNGTHFAPLPRTLDWAQARWFPLDQGPAILITLLVRAVLGAGTWVLLRELFGARLGALVPLGVVLFTPALVPATAYYRQAITALAATAAVLWAIAWHLRWLRTGGLWNVLGVGAATAIGLGCYEKAAAIPFLLFVVTVLLFAGPGGLWPTLRQAIVPIALSAVLVAAFAVIYVRGPYDHASGGLPPPALVGQMARNAVFDTVLPLLLGGPWRWFPITASYGGVSLAHSTLVAFWIVAGVFGVWCLVRRPGPTARAITLLIAWVIPSVITIGVGRLGIFGLSLAEDVRFFTDAVPAFVICAALAVLPWRVGAYAGQEPRPTRIGAAVAAVLGALVVAGSVASWITFANAWWSNPTGQWVANMKASLAAAGPSPRIVALPLPQEILPSWVDPVFPTYSPLVMLIRPDARFNDGDGLVQALDSAGALRLFRPTPIAETRRSGLCVAAIPATGSQTVIRMPVTVPYVRGSQLQLGLLTEAPSEITVQMITAEGVVRPAILWQPTVLQAGPHTLRTPVRTGDRITAVRVLDGLPAKVCVTSASIVRFSP
jgi:hypothetical protein